MDWHNRFLQQANWTHDLRVYLLERAGVSHAKRVLEVGCGTGAIISDITTPFAIHGLDIMFDRLVETRSHTKSVNLVCGNAQNLPYHSSVFDITYCHYLLMWVYDPLLALMEMKRITRSGGAVLALAEPDYDSRVDKPDELVQLGIWQSESLRRQGADPGLGSRLAFLFQQAGIRLVETGTMQENQECPSTQVESTLEWAVLESDLEGWIPVQEICRMKKLDRRAWERSERVLHVPTHFAWGIV